MNGMVERRRRAGKTLAQLNRRHRLTPERLTQELVREVARRHRVQRGDRGRDHDGQEKNSQGRPQRIEVADIGPGERIAAEAFERPRAAERKSVRPGMIGEDGGLPERERYEGQIVELQPAIGPQQKPVERKR